jgi:hypothetical protein
MTVADRGGMAAAASGNLNVTVRPPDTDMIISLQRQQSLCLSELLAS